MPQAPAVSGTQMLLGLAVGVALLVILILRTKIHAFPAMILAASVTGLVGGMDPVALGKSITTGFGNTLGSIGLVIGFGVMMGRILEVSGAAERMALTFVRTIGSKRPELAMAVTGYMVSIPIFVDSGFVILNPLAKALARRSGKSMLTMGVSLAVGLATTHHLVPPTPGPLGTAGIFKADIGQMILWGLVFAIPVMAIGVAYANWLGRKIYIVPHEDGTFERKEWKPEYEKRITVEERKDLPSAFLSFLPIIGPVILIIFNTVLSAMKATGAVANFLIFLGNPVIAVLVGLLLAIYGLGARTERKSILKQMEEGVQSAGIIMLVTGAGGSLGQVLRDSGAGDYLAKVIAGSPVPAILLPFVVATFIRLIQGSGTVAMLTASSITAPILAGLGGINPVFAAQSAAMGAFVFSYFNDSLFWVVNRMQGIDEVKEQVLTWSVPTTIAWASSGILLVIVNALFG